MCSCSPTVFTFIINLEGDCGTNDIQGNAGIDGSVCFVVEGVTVPDRATMMSSAYVDALVKTNIGSDISGRELQADDPLTEIVSVHFLEFDSSGDLTVINQDDTYADVSLVTGATLDFESASSFLDTSVQLEDQGLVPGGASLILYGKTASGNVVRNRFFWTYDMNCGRENDPVQAGDSIGWVTVVSICTSLLVHRCRGDHSSNLFMIHLSTSSSFKFICK